MAQGLSSVESPLSLDDSRRERRHGGSASIAGLISVLLHGALFAMIGYKVYQETPAPRRIIIPEARLAPTGMQPGEFASSVAPAGGPQPRQAESTRLESAPLPSVALPALPELPDVLPIIAAPAGESTPTGASFISAVVAPLPMGGSTAGTAGAGGAAAALTGIGPAAAFFGQGGNAYKIVYVVDLSGSVMIYAHEIMRQMRQSIRDLIPTQSFHIVITSNREVREFGPRRLVPANAQYKRDAAAFLETIRGGGKADPIQAMMQAFAVGPELIYFLSDGDYKDVQEEFEKRVGELNASHAVAITTIGFDPSPGPSKLLERLARRHGGHFRLVQLQN